MGETGVAGPDPVVALAVVVVAGDEADTKRFRQRIKTAPLESLSCNNWLPVDH